MEPKGRHVAEMPLRATTKGGTCLRCEPKGRHVAEVIKRLLPFLSLLVARCSLVFRWCRPDHLSDVPPFHRPRRERAARAFDGHPVTTMSGTSSRWETHAEKGRHVPLMAIPQQQRTARRADGKKRRHVSWMRRKGRHVELMKPKGRHVAQVCFAPQRRAALLVCISATCRPLRWAAKGRHVDEIDFWTPPSKTRAALFPHGPGKGGTSARWNWADL